MTNEKEKALLQALSQIERQFGRGAVMKLGEFKTNNEENGIPTGLVSFDYITGIGGIPRGRIIEIFGLESAGKTSFALAVVAAFQKMGKICAYIDVENALDPQYAQSVLKVQPESLYISQPDSGEQALEILENLARSGAVDLIIVDSVAALVPKSELDGNMGDPTMASQARLMSQALRKITPILNKTQTTVVFINQLRHKIGGYGNPEVTTGGLALKYYASMRIEVKKKDTIKQGENIIGHRVKIKIVKNKMSAPFRSTEIDFYFKSGFASINDMVDIGIELGLINKSGMWYTYEGLRTQGREKMIAVIEENKQLHDKLKQTIMEKLSEKKLDKMEEMNETTE